MSTNKVPSRVGGLMVIVGVGLLLMSCTQHMAVQPRYQPYQPSDLFADGTSARPLPADTVARGHLQDDTLLFTGKDANGQDGTQLPFPVTRDMLERGRTRFEIYCLPCHGYAGDGDGMIVQRGFLPPPSFHLARLEQAPVGHFFDAMTNGFGAMPSYAGLIPVPDRWAIVAYIRVLQLSQHATVDDTPPDARAQLAQQP